jgi:outer membrane protein assembly factor BamB
MSWTHWRGPTQNGISGNRDLPDTWVQGGENQLWSQPYGGRSCPLVMNGRVYIIGAAGEGVTTHERVVCFNAETGETLWEYPFNVFLTTIVRNRVGWANLAGDPETGNIFVHGVQDLMLCLDADGKLVWSRSLTEEFGAVSGYGGRVHSPVVDEDRVIISFLNSSWGSHAPPRHRYLALDKRTGEILWWAAPGGQPLDTTYCTPVFTVINGERLMIAGNADGSVYAMKARTGETVWSFRLSLRGINSSVVVEGDRVFACHGEENLAGNKMGTVICIDATGRGDVTETHAVWRHDGIEVGYASPALHDGRLYVVDNSANLHCFKTEDGEPLWTHDLGNVGRGSSPVVADGKIYVTEYQHFLILRPSDTGCETLDVDEFPGGEGLTEVWGSPAVAGGRIYFTTMEGVYAVGFKDWTGRNDPIPPVAATEEPAAPDATPAVLHVVPADVTLAPGNEAVFEAVAFDAHGRRIGAVPAEFHAPPTLKGELTADGKLRVSEENAGQGVQIEAKAGDLTGTARVRVLQDLPIEEDFESYKPDASPPHWLTTRMKFAVVEQDGNKVLRKTNHSPSVPLVRATAFFGPPEWSNYTIAADFVGSEERFNLPEYGVVNSRYEMTLVGNDEVLRVSAWDALPRLTEDVDFAMTPGVWYRMKLRVDVDEEDHSALVRGKVWPRDDPEPEAWTIEVEDPLPHRNGSPGVYAYAVGTVDDAPGTEVLIDNVRVETNEP